MQPICFMIMIFVLLTEFVLSGPIFYFPLHKKIQKPTKPSVTPYKIEAQPVVHKDPSIRPKVSGVFSGAATNTPSSTSSAPKPKNNFSHHISSSSIWYPCAPNMCDPY
ncbi:hypothetical protein HMI56_002482 [Coelomomyces lativittatus]|nr:hypothetical protein HMI56_002482 [Coelomomyces lativittatus]